MRFLVVIMALLSLPGVLVLHHKIFFMQTQGELSAAVGKVVNNADFPDVSASIDYLDVKLTGEVDSFEAREEAQKLADAVHGARCRPGDNHLLVRPALKGVLEGNQLTLSGWMDGEKSLEKMTTWLQDARPDLVIDSSDVIFPAAVLPLEEKEDEKVPFLLQKIWQQVRIPASLKVEADDGGNIVVEGSLPGGTFQDAIALSLQKARPDSVLKIDGLKSGRYIQPANFAESTGLPDLLEKFFSGPGPRTFEASDKAITLAAQVVVSEPPTWQTLLDGISGEIKPTLKLSVFPSIWQMPGYKPISALEEPALKALREVLAQNVVLFLPGEMTVIETEFAKLDAIAQAVIAAGPAVRLVVGGYPETNGDFTENSVAAARRAEAVVTALQERSVAPEVLQAVAYEPAPGTYAAFARGVECVVK